MVIKAKELNYITSKLIILPNQLVRSSVRGFNTIKQLLFFFLGFMYTAQENKFYFL